MRTRTSSASPSSGTSAAALSSVASAVGTSPAMYEAVAALASAGATVIGSLSIDRVAGADSSRLGGAPVDAGLTYRVRGAEARVAFNLAAKDRELPTPLGGAGLRIHAGQSAETTHRVLDSSGKPVEM